MRMTDSEALTLIGNIAMRSMGVLLVVADSVVVGEPQRAYIMRQRKWYEQQQDMMSGKLTAEQVRDAVMSADRWKKPMGNTGLTNTHLIIRDDGWQAIADELNAELGSGTCELVETDRYTNSRETIHVLECSECGETCEHVNGIYPRCPHCGKVVIE